jgi:hypothetical protein
MKRLRIDIFRIAIRLANILDHGASAGAAREARDLEIVGVAKNTSAGLRRDPYPTVLWRCAAHARNRNSNRTGRRTEKRRRTGIARGRAFGFGWNRYRTPGRMGGVTLDSVHAVRFKARRSAGMPARRAAHIDAIFALRHD